jgi:hypothetical protein
MSSAARPLHLAIAADLRALGEELRVHRWAEAGYIVVLNAQRAQRVRAEPFEAIELPIGVFFGDDPDE